MRPFLEGAIGPLLDSRARRALEETLVDWSHEAALARSPLERLYCHARAVLAIARTTVSIILNEIVELPANEVWLRIGFWFLASFPVHLYANGWFRFSRATEGVGLQVALALLLLPTWFVLVAPLAFFLGAAFRGHRRYETNCSWIG